MMALRIEASKGSLLQTVSDVLYEPDQPDWWQRVDNLLQAGCAVKLLVVDCSKLQPDESRRRWPLTE